MNTETLIDTNNKEVQPVKPIELNALKGKKEAERASCGNGVCEVAWKPYEQQAQRSTKKNGA